MACMKLSAIALFAALACGVTATTVARADEGGAKRAGTSEGVTSLTAQAKRRLKEAGIAIFQKRIDAASEERQRRAAERLSGGDIDGLAEAMAERSIFSELPSVLDVTEEQAEAISAERFDDERNRQTIENTLPQIAAMRGSGVSTDFDNLAQSLVDYALSEEGGQVDRELTARVLIAGLRKGEIRLLIFRLGDDSTESRTEARERLIAIGEEARPAMERTERDASRSSDYYKPPTAQQLREILKELDDARKTESPRGNDTNH